MAWEVPTQWPVWRKQPVNGGGAFVVFVALHGPSATQAQVNFKFCKDELAQPLIFLIF